jgi:hypothetical protein
MRILSHASTHRRAGLYAVLSMLCVADATALEPALFSTLEDGSHALLMPTPDVASPAPTQQLFGLPGGAAPHGVAFRGATEALFADFATPTLYRASLTTPATVQQFALTGRSNGNGSLAASADGRFVLSIGQSNAGVAESIVMDFATDPPTIAPIVPAMRVLGFVTAAIDFAPDGRAFVCHTGGVSVLRPPYSTVDFTMTFPTITQSPSMCRLTRDGSRLFVTRVLSESVPSINGVRTTAAPYSAGSSFVTMVAPGDAQGLGPMVVSPDGQALIVGQQFLFPQAPLPPKARAWLLRAPFNAQTAYAPLALPATALGMNCTAESSPADCPGFEHIELSHDGRLAILTGNSSSVFAGVPDRVPAVFIRDPFDDGARSTFAVQLAPAAATPGRGSGAVRFQPARIFFQGFEDTQP